MSLQRKEKCLVLLGFTRSAHEVENTTKTPRQSTCVSEEEKKEMKTAQPDLLWQTEFKWQRGKQKWNLEFLMCIQTDLIPLFPLSSYVTINPTLCDCLLEKSEYQEVDALKWDDLFTR